GGGGAFLCLPGSVRPARPPTPPRPPSPPALRPTGLSDPPNEGLPENPGTSTGGRLPMTMTPPRVPVAGGGSRFGLGGSVVPCALAASGVSIKGMARTTAQRVTCPAKSRTASMILIAESPPDFVFDVCPSRAVNFFCAASRIQPKPAPGRDGSSDLSQLASILLSFT